MSVGRVCIREVYLAERSENAAQAAERMWRQNVGALVVISDDRKPIGIVTDRDLVIRALARGLDANKVKVAQVMTENPKIVAEDTPIEEALGLMRSGAFRRLPVVNRRGELVGIFSTDDFLDLVGEEFERIRGLLQNQGRPTLHAA